MANHHTSYAGNKISHSLSKYPISHSGYCKNRVNLRRCICLGSKKKSPKELEVLSFSCNFTSVATPKFSKHEFLSLTMSTDGSSACMYMLYINPLTSITIVPHLFSFFCSMFKPISALRLTPSFIWTGSRGPYRLAFTCEMYQRGKLDGSQQTKGKKLLSNKSQRSICCLAGVPLCSPAEYLMALRFA